MSIIRTIRNEFPALVVIVMTLSAILLCAVGWIWNIVKLIAIVADPLTGMFILRCVGVIFAPLGIILGYL